MVHSVALRLAPVFDGKGHSSVLRSIRFFGSWLSLFRKLGQHLYKKDKRLQPWLMALTVWGGMIPFFILFSAAGAWGVFADRLQAFQSIWNKYMRILSIYNNIIGNILLLCTSGSFITLFLIVCFSQFACLPFLFAQVIHGSSTCWRCWEVWWHQLQVEMPRPSC